MNIQLRSEDDFSVVLLPYLIPFLNNSISFKLLESSSYAPLRCCKACGVAHQKKLESSYLLCTILVETTLMETNVKYKIPIHCAA